MKYLLKSLSAVWPILLTILGVYAGYALSTHQYRIQKEEELIQRRNQYLDAIELEVDFNLKFKTNSPMFKPTGDSVPLMRHLSSEALSGFIQHLPGLSYGEKGMRAVQFSEVLYARINTLNQIIDLRNHNKYSPLQKHMVVTHDSTIDSGLSVIVNDYESFVELIGGLRRFDMNSMSMESDSGIIHALNILNLKDTLSATTLLVLIIALFLNWHTTKANVKLAEIQSRPVLGFKFNGQKTTQTHIFFELHNFTNVDATAKVMLALRVNGEDRTFDSVDYSGKETWSSPARSVQSGHTELPFGSSDPDALDILAVDIQLFARVTYAKWDSAKGQEDGGRTYIAPPKKWHWDYSRGIWIPDITGIDFSETS